MIEGIIPLRNGYLRKLALTICCFCFALELISCKAQSNINQDCRENFKKTRELVYSGYSRQSALDSGLIMINTLLPCDTIRKAVVDFKITLLASMKKYSEGIRFIDSLEEKDFAFDYKQKYWSKVFQSLIYRARKDTVNLRLLFKNLNTELEKYAKGRTIHESEFKEFYTDLLFIKAEYMSDIDINREIDALIKLYPGEEFFFEFFKK